MADISHVVPSRHLQERNSSSINMVLAALREGTTMTRFFPSGKRKPENRIFSLKLNELQLCWWRTPGQEEGMGKFSDII